MKKLVFLFLFIAFSFVSFAQQDVLMQNLIRKYDTISELKDLKTSNLYSFTTKGKVGLANIMGKLVYEPYFDSISVYNVDGAVYIKGKMPNGRTALLNADGLVLFQPYYEDVFIVEGDFLLTKQKGKYGMANFDGLGYLYPEFDTVKVMIDEDTFFVANMGEKNMVFNTHSEVVKYFDKDTVITFLETENSSLLPFDWIIEPKCEVVKYIGGGNFYIREGETTKIINKKGEIVEPKKMIIDSKNVVNFDWSRILFRRNALIGMADYDGKVIVDPTYEDMSVVIEDEMYSYKLNEKWGLINREGKIITNPQFEGFTTVTYNGDKYIKTTNSNNKTALLNRRGRPIFQAYYDDIEPANKDGFYNQIQNGGKGIISKEGIMYVYPEYDEVKAYLGQDTFFIARRNSRYTVFGTKGEKVYDGLNAILDIQDSSITYLENNILKRAVIKDNKIFPNPKIINVKYKAFGEIFDSIIIVKDSKGWTYANKKTFRPLTEKHFDFITPITKGYAFVVEGKELNIIDRNFNTVFTVISKGLVQAELEQMATLLQYAYKQGMSYQYVRKDDKYGIFRLKAIKEVRIKK
jgi:hypothetical protein